MITEQLQKKIDRAIRLLQAYDDKQKPIEIAYSGGKDSDVILQLAKEANINFRAIYRNTTIDPPGTIRHAKEMNVEILQPKRTFFQIIHEGGFPSRYRRFCCKYLKEYKILDKCIMGVRKAESVKRSKRYNEPTECKWYGKKTEENHVEAIFPILEWTDEDVRDFILDRNIKCAPVYYDMGGVFHVERRLGCMGCPLKSNKQRIADFKEHPRMLKAWLRAGQKYRELHPNTKAISDVYKQMVRELYFRKHQDFLNSTSENLFGEDDIDYKAFLEEQFGIDLTL